MRLQKTLLMLFVVFPQRCPSNIHSLVVPFKTRLDFFFFSQYFSLRIYPLICASHFPKTQTTKTVFLSASLAHRSYFWAVYVLRRERSLLHSCSTPFLQTHIVTVVVQRAVVSSDHTIAPDKPETHATVFQVFKIVKPWWRSPGWAAFIRYIYRDYRLQRATLATKPGQ